jgi:hypothetical protein
LAYNGSGLFVRLYNWVTDKTNSVPITASRMDQEMDGFAAGLSNCLTRDGQGRANADFLPATDNTLACGTQALRWLSFNGVAKDFFLPTNKVKSVITSRTANSTLADPDLVAALQIGTYRFELFIDAWGTTTSTQGIGFFMNFTGTSTRAIAQTRYNGGLVSGTAFTLANLGTTTRGQQIIMMQGVFVTTTTGNLEFRWGTNSNNGNNTNVGDGSYLRVQQIA